jgi:hypothetical protein
VRSYIPTILSANIYANKNAELDTGVNRFLSRLGDGILSQAARRPY